jgi:hypothetical protein
MTEPQGGMVTIRVNIMVPAASRRRTRAGNSHENILTAGSRPGHSLFVQAFF